jgi:DNA sulfur modification protein DndB
MESNGSQNTAVEPRFEYTFPAIRGVQAKREFYVSMCPLRLIPKIFLFDEEELIPELRAQRTLNKSRIPEIARYIVQNRDNYTFSALTASIDAEIRFDPLGEARDFQRIGLLHVPMTAKFIVNDGQHRRAAIEAAIRERPDLADESIAVVFFLDLGLARCQQMFADLNRYAIRPSTSIAVLYDHRDDWAKLAKVFIARSDIFTGVVELERSSLSLRSRKLFTLSAIYHSTAALMAGHTTGSIEKDAALAQEFWEAVAGQFPEWGLVRAGKIPACEVRSRFIHSHGMPLHALGKVGNCLFRECAGKWQPRLRRLKNLDWSRDNAKFWEGRAMIGGRVSKAAHNVVLTTNAIKQCLGLQLTPDENRVEQAFLKGGAA